MPRAAKAKVKQATVRSLERALQEERLAIAAVTKVMLIEVPDPGRVLARLDSMVRTAELNPRVPVSVRRQLLDAARFVRTAIEREQGRPQSLFDPHVGHVKKEAVDALVAPTESPEQLGFVTNESVLGDVEVAHEQRVQTIVAVHGALVECLRSEGSATDAELWSRYQRMLAPGVPFQSRRAITERRKELVAAGRVVRVDPRGGVPAWDVVERDLLENS